MDAQGWISVPLIASFNRIKNLTSDLSIVVETMRMTPVLEVSPKGRFVRLAQTWPEWILPNAQKNDDVEKDFEEGRAEVKALHERKEKERVEAEAKAKEEAGKPSAEVDDVAQAKDDARDDVEPAAPAEQAGEPEAAAGAEAVPAAAAEDKAAPLAAVGDKAPAAKEGEAEATEVEEEAPAAESPAKKDAGAAPRKESLSPRDGVSNRPSARCLLPATDPQPSRHAAPRTISPKATLAQPILDTAVVSVAINTPSSSA